MPLSVTGNQLEVDAAPRRRNETHQTAFVIEVLAAANEADIVFSRGVQPSGAAISSPIGQGTPFRDSLEADNPYPSFYMTLESVLNCGAGPQSPSYE